jgi:hypothetical protein
LTESPLKYYIERNENKRIDVERCSEFEKLLNRVEGYMAVRLLARPRKKVEP